MSKRAYKLVVLTNAVEGKDAEFNDWYSRIHLPDVLGVPGIVRAERFELAGVQRTPQPLPYRYLAIYEIETDDLQLVSDEIGKRAGTDAMFISDAMAHERLAAFFEPL